MLVSVVVVFFQRRNRITLNTHKQPLFTQSTQPVALFILHARLTALCPGLLG